MKTIIATVAAAAAITAGVTVAGAQDLGGSSSAGVSPYVGFEYTTTPTTAGVGGATADTWFGGDATSNVVVGVEAALPWDLTMDASVGMSNATDKDATTPDTSAFDFGGFDVDGVDITIAYEVMDGMSVYSTTEFGLATDGVVRESTSVGMMWKF